MKSMNTYLLFRGNCAEAFEFYKRVFGGTIENKASYREMPKSEESATPEADLNLIMHISLVINEHTVLMGSDMSSRWSDGYIAGNNFSICIGADSPEEADRLFNELSRGGEIEMPLQNSFWGTYFGMLKDQFGTSWMIDGPAKEEK